MEAINNFLTPITALITEIGIIVAVLIPCIAVMACLTNGMRCLLRSEMLRIYYHNRESQTIRQYEKENFTFLYNAYKALKGNSFIDDILVAFGVADITIEQVIAVITAGAAMIAYIIGEGLVDVARESGKNNAKESEAADNENSI